MLCIWAAGSAGNIGITLYTGVIIRKIRMALRMFLQEAVCFLPLTMKESAMAKTAKEELNEAFEAFERMEGYRTDAGFREEYDEKDIKLEQAILEVLEAIYHQNQVIIKLLGKRREEK